MDLDRHYRRPSGQRLRLARPVGQTRTLLWWAVVVLVVSPLFGVLEGKEDTPEQTAASLTLLEWKELDLNRIRCSIASDGRFAYDPDGRAGLDWPRGSGINALFIAGLWISGRHVVTDSLRTANAEFWNEFQPGPLLEVFNTTTLDDAGPVARASDPRYRLYKITRGDTTSPDYVEWPGDLGAPYEDRNGNGSWDQGIDRPRFLGDQQIWGVTNDVNRSLHATVDATAPMGVEVRALFYVLDRPGVIQDAMFMEWTIINRSDTDYRDLYISLWSDPDLGDGFDDMTGSDSTLGLGYAYNGTDLDRYYGPDCPAAGFVFLAGPSIPAAPTDSARRGDRWVHGWRNLLASSFVTYPKTAWFYSVPFIWTPPVHTYEYSRVVHNYQEGKEGTGSYLLRQDSSRYPLYWLSGDPVAGTGDLPENFPTKAIPPTDMRMLLTSGPCSLAAGDTQYIASAFFLARGPSRLESIVRLKGAVDTVRTFYAAGGLDVPMRQLLISPDNFVFDSTEVGQRAEPYRLELASVGREPLTILELQTPDPSSYAVSSPTLPFAIDSGQTASIELQFLPATRGYHPDSLVIISDDPVHPRRTVTFDGWGYTMFPAEPGVLYGAGSSLVTIRPSDLSVSTIGLFYPFANWRISIHPRSGIIYAPVGHSILRICSQNLDRVEQPAPISVVVSSMGFAPDGRVFASAPDGSLYTFDLENGDSSFIGNSGEGTYFNSLVFNPNDSTLWACPPRWASEPDRILKVDAATAATHLVGKLGNNLPILSLARTADGTLLALQSNEASENTLYRVDTVSGAGTLLGSLGISGLTSIAMWTDTLAVAVDETPQDLPTAWKLAPPYPNPANATAWIRYELPEEASVTITVFDILGRRVRVLQSGNQRAGSYEVDWDGCGESGLPTSSGVYFIRMEGLGSSGSMTVLQRRMIYLK